MFIYWCSMSKALHLQLLENYSAKAITTACMHALISFDFQGETGYFVVVLMVIVAILLCGRVLHCWNYTPAAHHRMQTELAQSNLNHQMLHMLARSHSMNNMSGRQAIGNNCNIIGDIYKFTSTEGIVILWLTFCLLLNKNIGYFKPSGLFRPY